MAYAWLARVKGEKCIERAREREKQALLIETSFNRHWLGTTILSSSPFLSLSNHCAKRPAYNLYIITRYARIRSRSLGWKEAARTAAHKFQRKFFPREEIVKIISWEWNWLVQPTTTLEKLTLWNGATANGWYTSKHIHVQLFFGGKWFPCSIRGLLTRRTPHSIGLLCLITVTIFSVGVCLVLFFRWKLPGTSERVDRKTKVMAVLTCLLYNTQTNTHTHIQPRDFKPPDCSHTHRLDPTLRLAHHSSSDLHPTFCCVYFALYLNSFFFKEEERTYVFFFFSLFARIEFPTFLIFFYFSRKKNVCLCVVHVPI